MSLKYREELDALLSEDDDLVLDRERSSFDRLSAPLTDDLVLFGAGNLGRRTLRGLRRMGIEPRAFSDNNAGLWGKPVEGVEVLSPEEAAARFGGSAVVVVCIWGASGHRLAQTREQLARLGCLSIVSFAYLYWKYAEVFLPYYALDLPHKLCAQRDRVREVFDRLSDEASQREYVAQVRWRLRLDFDGLPGACPGEPYFPEGLFELRPDEVFVDCGAYDGDTLREFLRRRGEDFARAVAVEPDPHNLAKLRQYVDSLDGRQRSKIHVHGVALGAAPGKVSFDASGTMTASAAAHGSVEVDCARLDDLVGDCAATYVKMDIEGAELEALAGAVRTIESHRPVLGISVYHRQSDLWRIPLWVHRLCLDYAMFLRPYHDEAWDLTCYMVPRERAS